MVEATKFALEPKFDKKFRVSRAKEVIGVALREKLTGVEYHADNTSTWAKEISDEIKMKLKEENWERYKFIVQVLIGEQRGAGVKMGCRGFWDIKTDNFAQEEFSNESIFCIAVAFGMYVY